MNLEKITEQVLGYAENGGAEMAYVSASQIETREFNVDNDKFSLMRTVFDRGLSVTVIADGKRGSAAVNRLDGDSIKKAAVDALDIAKSGEADEAFDICHDKYEKNFTDGCPDGDEEKLFERTKELLFAIKDNHPKIAVEQMIVSHVRKQGVYRNTSGTLFTNLSGAYGVELMYSAHEGESSTSFFSSGVITDNLDTPFIELGSIDSDLSDVEAQLNPSSVEGKFIGTMLLPPSCLGSFMGDIVENFGGDVPVIEGTSIWKDKLGEVVADKRLTVRIDPTFDGAVCGEKYTAEGFLSEPFDFIRDGVLKSFYLSLYAARKTGNEQAKNTGGYLNIPAGNTPLADIIKNIKHGIVVGRFSGGDPSVSGEFSGVAKNSFEIVDGKITRPLSETMISGNLADILVNIAGISSERICDGASVMPYIAFDGITVSGK